MVIFSLAKNKPNFMLLGLCPVVTTVKNNISGFHKVV